MGLPAESAMSSVDKDALIKSSDMNESMKLQAIEAAKEVHQRPRLSSNHPCTGADGELCGERHCLTRKKEIRQSLWSYMALCRWKKLW